MISYMNFNMGNTRDIIEELFVRLDDIRYSYEEVTDNPALVRDVEQALIRLLDGIGFDTGETLGIVSRRVRLTKPQAKLRYGRTVYF